MTLLEYFGENPASFWFAIGALALVIELVVLGMSTIVRFLAGLGSLITALLIYLGVVPGDWLTGFAVMGVLSFMLGVLLWKPLKQYQAAEPPRSGHSSDFVGYEFALSSLLDRETQSTHQFSGVSWRVELALEEGDKSLASGDRVRVVALHPGILVVTQA